MKPKDSKSRPTGTNTTNFTFTIVPTICQQGGIARAHTDTSQKGKVHRNHHSMLVRVNRTIAATHQTAWMYLFRVMLHKSPANDNKQSLGCDTNVSNAYGRAENVLLRRKGENEIGWGLF